MKIIKKQTKKIKKIILVKQEHIGIYSKSQSISLLNIKINNYLLHIALLINLQII